MQGSDRVRFVVCLERSLPERTMYAHVILFLSSDIQHLISERARLCWRLQWECSACTERLSHTQRNIVGLLCFPCRHDKFGGAMGLPKVVPESLLFHIPSTISRIVQRDLLFSRS